jgi:hypothetical protein
VTKSGMVIIIGHHYFYFYFLLLFNVQYIKGRVSHDCMYVLTRTYVRGEAEKMNEGMNRQHQ